MTFEYQAYLLPRRGAAKSPVISQLFASVPLTAAALPADWLLVFPATMRPCFFRGRSMSGKRTLADARALAAAAAAAVLVAFPVASAAKQDQRATQHFEDALRRFERHDTAGAVVQLKNALQQDPTMLAAYVLLGKAYVAEGEPAAAEEALAKALQLGVDRSEIAVPLAEALFAQGKFEALLDRVPADGLPPSRKAALLTLRARAHLGLGDVKAAQRTYEEALGVDRSYVPALLGLAEVAVKQRRASETVKLADEAAAVAPNDARVWHFRGHLAQGRGDMKSALENYSKALALDERLLEPRVARAAILIDLGQLDEASRDVEQLRVLHPRQPRALYVRALYASKRGDEAATRDIMAELTRALDPVPRETLRRSAPELLLFGGLAHHGLGQLEKASSYLVDYLAVEPRHVGARKLLASIRISQGDARDAISLLEPARKAAPKDYQVLTLLAAAHMARGQHRLASGYLEEALKASGGAPEVEATLGFSLIGSGRTDAGLEHLERAFKKDPGQSQAGMALTVAYLRRGEARAAVETAEAVARRQPKSAVALNLLGVARQAAGDRKGARSAYESAAKITKDLTAPQINLARLDLGDGNVERARSRVQGVLKDRPRDTQAMYELALVEERAGRPEEAIRWLEKARALNRRNVAASAKLIDLYVAAKAPDKALDVAKALESVLPDDVEAQTTLARAYLALGNRKAAEVALTRATRLAAFDPARQTELARYQLAAGNVQGAVYSLEKALSGDPEYLPAQALLAEVDLQRGELAKAEQRARAMIKRHPGRAAGYRLLGDIELAKGAAAEALTAYQTALAKEETIENALGVVRAHIRTRNPGKAAEFLESWVKARPDDLVALRALAEAHLIAKNLPAARLRYEELLKRQGESPDVLNNLANVLLAQGDRKALEYAERAHRLAPQNAAIQDTLGWALVKQGELDRGLRHLREARLRDPSSPEIRYHLASALARAGRRNEARDELDQALRGAPKFDELAEAQKLQRELSTP